MTTAPICFLDCETDGVHPHRKVWEVAAIRREPDGSETEWQAFVEIDLSTADPFGLRVGRFYDRHPFGRLIAHEDHGGIGDSLLPAQAAIRVAQITHGAHIVGAVPSFDAECLAALLRSQGLTPAWHYHLIDVEALAVGWLAYKAKTIREQHPEINLKPWPQLPWESDDLNRALGLAPVPAAERHTALGDARWALRMYDAVMSGGAR